MSHSEGLAVAAVASPLGEALDLARLLAGPVEAVDVEAVTGRVRVLLARVAELAPKPKPGESRPREIRALDAALIHLGRAGGAQDARLAVRAAGVAVVDAAGVLGVWPDRYGVAS